MSVAGRQLSFAALPPSHAPRFKPGNVTCSKESVTYLPDRSHFVTTEETSCCSTGKHKNDRNDSRDGGDKR